MSAVNFTDPKFDPMTHQLPLPIFLRDDFTFDNFYFENNNQIIPAALKAISDGIGEDYLYLWGYAGVGRSHLLQACCQSSQAQGQQVIYLPLGLTLTSELTPTALDNLENLDLICLDDLQTIAGNKAWEEAIFHLYNRCQTTHCRLIITANAVPKELDLQLPDLISRLTHGVILQIQELTDSEKITALQLRAQRRGLELSTEVGQFLLNHAPRNLGVLCADLEKLDQASLAEQRRLTIPFLKKILQL